MCPLWNYINISATGWIQETRKTNDGIVFLSYLTLKFMLNFPIFPWYRAHKFTNQCVLNLIIIIIISPGLNVSEHTMPASPSSASYFGPRSNAEKLTSCRLAPHHSMISSIHSLNGHPLLLFPSINPKTGVFKFLSSDIWHTYPNNFNLLSITVCSRLRLQCLIVYRLSHEHFSVVHFLGPTDSEKPCITWIA